MAIHLSKFFKKSDRSALDTPCTSLRGRRGGPIIYMTKPLTESAFSS